MADTHLHHMLYFILFLPESRLETFEMLVYIKELMLYFQGLQYN